MIDIIKSKIYRFLHWSEKYTKTDNAYLAKGGFWITLSQIIVSLSSFLLAIAFASFVSKDLYGQYKYVMSVVGILGSFTLTGMGTAVARSVAKNDEGTLNFAFWQNIKWSLLFFLSFLGLSIYYFASGDNNLGLSMIIAGSLSPFFSSTNYYSSFLVAKKDYRRNSIYFDTIGNLFPVVCIFLTMFVATQAWVFVLVYFLSNFIIGLYFYLKVVRLYCPNNKIDKEAVTYGKHLSLMGILTGIANNIDQVLLFHYLGAVELAVYSFAMAIPNQIKGPLKGLDNLMFPNFSNRTSKEIRQNMDLKILYLFLALLILVITYILAAPTIFYYLLPKYLDSVSYSQIFAISILGLASYPATTYLAAHKKIKGQYINNTVLSVIQIALVFIMLKTYGLWGVIYARVIMRIVSGISTYIVYRTTSAQDLT